MKTNYILYLGLLLCCSLQAKAGVIDSTDNYSIHETALQAFIQKNPHMMTIECLQDETMHVASDGTHLFIELEVINPQLLMRFVMKGFSIFIDPTGHKKERFELEMPSAENLDLAGLEFMHDKNDEPNQISEDKPNILPLIDPLIQKGMQYCIGGKVENTDNQIFSMYLDVEHDCLYYYAFISLKKLLETKKLSSTWTLGFYSPEVAENHDQQQKMMPPPPDNIAGHQSLEQFTQEIAQWIAFDFDKLCSLNLK